MLFNQSAYHRRFNGRYAAREEALPPRRNAVAPIFNTDTTIKKARAPAIEHLSRTASVVVNSGQAALQHTKKSDYGCFLSDLTGFAGIPLSRTQPSTSRAPNLTKGQNILRREFNLAKADCELQDTANFPSSAGKMYIPNQKT